MAKHPTVCWHATLLFGHKYFPAKRLYQGILLHWCCAELMPSRAHSQLSDSWDHASNT